ncbi:MAG: hypothetical protein HYR74_02570 [Candidatus Eisenbacteria bacterium]|nr:hypothetical protein [Candidatus Eisenbacteria bacterium]
MTRTRIASLAMIAALLVVACAARRAGAEPVEALNPDIAAHPYHLEAGPRQFVERLSFSPGFGWLGSHRLFVFRLGYNPNQWLGYEATLGHNPGQSVHAVLHTFTAILRHPFAGRFQPYLSAGYGMMMVFPGQSLNAAPVTKNALVAGGGLEFYIRSDLALRADVRDATVFGRDTNQSGAATLQYAQETVGLSFYRTIKP